MMKINIHLLTLFVFWCAIDVSNKDRKLSFIPEIHCFFRHFTEAEVYYCYLLIILSVCATIRRYNYHYFNFVINFTNISFSLYF